MDLLNADIATAHSLLARQKRRRKSFNDLAIHFNKVINDASAQGKFVVSLLWKDFGLAEEFCFEEELITELLEHIVSAGYEAELCYYTPYVSNPCGVVVAWGADAAKLAETVAENGGKVDGT